MARMSPMRWASSLMISVFFPLWALLLFRARSLGIAMNRAMRSSAVRLMILNRVDAFSVLRMDVLQVSRFKCFSRVSVFLSNECLL